jgi:hypothetical protein
VVVIGVVVIVVMRTCACRMSHAQTRKVICSA